MYVRTYKLRTDCSRQLFARLRSNKRLDIAFVLLCSKVHFFKLVSFHRPMDGNSAMYYNAVSRKETLR